MTTIGNHMRGFGYHTTITGDPRTKHTLCLLISARLISNVTTAEIKNYCEKSDYRVSGANNDCDNTSKCAWPIYS